MLQGAVHLTICLEILVFFGSFMHLPKMPMDIILRFSRFPMYRNILFSKGFTLMLILVVATGTRAKKDLDWDVKKHIVFALVHRFDSVFRQPFVAANSNESGGLFSLDDAPNLLHYRFRCGRNPHSNGGGQHLKTLKIGLNERPF